MRDATVKANVEYVASMDMMLTLVAAGYGVGFADAARIRVLNRPDIVIRPLATPNVIHTTYLLRPESGTGTLPPYPGSIYRAFARPDGRVTGNARSFLLTRFSVPERRFSSVAAIRSAASCSAPRRF